MKPIKIKSITPVKNEDVYDITVHDNHNFVANDILVHNCGEITLGELDSCRLIVINFLSFVNNPYTPKAIFNFDKFKDVVFKTMRLADDLVDLEIKAIERILNKIKSDPEPNEIKEREAKMWKAILLKGKEGRRTGIGFTALGDTLAAIGIKYDSIKAIEFIEEIMKTKFEFELKSSIELSKERGHFVGWDPNKEFPDEGYANSWYEMLSLYMPTDVIENMIKYGRRNVSWSTVAPTGSVSILTKTTSGIEPLFQGYYMRRKKINSDDPNVKADFIDDLGDKWTEHPVLHPQFKKWIEINHFKYDTIHTLEEILDNEDLIKMMFEHSPWFDATANDIDWLQRVKIQALIQKYTTHSISSTINLPNDISYEVVSEIYKRSHINGLKGITVYRDGSRAGVLVTQSREKNAFIQHNATKRPKELKAQVYHTTVKGIKYTVFVGLLDEKPYEVFMVEGYQFKQGVGTLKKEGKRKYVYRSGDIVSGSLSALMSDEHAAITRLVSTALRHGAHIKFIVEQLNKSEGDLFSFTKGLARILKKFIPDGSTSTTVCEICGSKNVVFQEGCEKCKDCGHSKC